MLLVRGFSRPHECSMRLNPCVKKLHPIVSCQCPVVKSGIFSSIGVNDHDAFLAGGGLLLVSVGGFCFDGLFPVRCRFLFDPFEIE